MDSNAICPFPFLEQPELPAIDQFLSAKAKRIPHIAPMLSRRKANAAASGGKLPPLGGAGGGAAPRRKGSVWGGSANVRGFSRSDIDHLVDFVQAQSDDPEKQEKIPLESFESAFRKHTSSSKTLNNDETARRHLLTIDLFLQLTNQNLYDWFVSIDVKGSGKLTNFKFHTALKNLAAQVNQPACFSPADLQILSHFMHPNLAKEISLDDIEMAFARLHRNTEVEEVRERVSMLLAFLKKIMDKEKIRVIDFYSCIDAGERGFVTPEDLRGALKVLILNPEMIAKRSRPAQSFNDEFKNGSNTTQAQGLKKKQGKGTGQRAGGVLNEVSNNKVGFVNSPEQEDPNVIRQSSTGDFGGSAVPFDLDDDVSVGSGTGSKRIIKPRKPVYNRQHKMYVQLMKDCQEHLDAKINPFEKANPNYRSQVRKGVTGYLKNVSYIDRCINNDLVTLSSL